jgi:hypothetical protein
VSGKGIGVPLSILISFKILTNAPTILGVNNVSPYRFTLKLALLIRNYIFHILCNRPNSLELRGLGTYQRLLSALSE